MVGIPVEATPLRPLLVLFREEAACEAQGRLRVREDPDAVLTAGTLFIQAFPLLNDVTSLHRNIVVSIWAKDPAIGEWSESRFRPDRFYANRLTALVRDSIREALE